MNNAKHLFARCLATYEQSGAESISAMVPQLIEAIEEHPGWKNYRAFLTDVLIDLESYEKAIELLLLTIDSTPPCDIDYNMLGFCYWELNRLNLAYPAYVKSVEINPENVPSLRGACFLAIELGRHDEAVDYCGRFHATSPSGRKEILWYAIALWWSGTGINKREALRLIDESPLDMGLRAEFHEAIAG